MNTILEPAIGITHDHFGGVIPPEPNVADVDWISDLNTRTESPLSWSIESEEYTEPKEECYFVRTHVRGEPGWTQDAKGWNDGRSRYEAIGAGRVDATKQIGPLPTVSEMNTRDDVDSWGGERVSRESSSGDYCECSECTYAVWKTRVPTNEEGYEYFTCEDRIEFHVTSDTAPLNTKDACQTVAMQHEECRPCASRTCNQRPFWFASNDQEMTSLICTNEHDFDVTYINDAYDNLDEGASNAQNIHYTYLYSMMGHIRDSNFPDSLLPGDTSTHQLSHECHSAVIEKTYMSPILPSASDGAKFPVKCIHTLICVLHWCGSEEITFTAGDTGDFLFEIYHYGVVKNHLRIVSSSPNNSFRLMSNRNLRCLNKDGTTSCPNSITFQAYSHTLSSSLKARKHITISNTRTSRQCFDFPFEYNWDNSETISTEESSSSKDLYFNDDNSYLPPATVTHRSQVLNIAISLEGTAVATYQITEPDIKRIFSQVCDSSSDQPVTLPHFFDHSIILDNSNIKDITAISDDGSTIAIGIERQYVHIFFKNLADDVSWPGEFLNFDTTRDLVINHVYLSAGGYFLSVVQDSNLYLYEKRLFGSGYILIYPNDDPRIEGDGRIDHASIVATEAGIVSIQTRDTNDNEIFKFQVRLFCTYLKFIVFDTR